MLDFWGSDSRWHVLPRTFSVGAAARAVRSRRACGLRALPRHGSWFTEGSLAPPGSLIHLLFQACQAMPSQPCGLIRPRCLVVSRALRPSPPPEIRLPGRAYSAQPGDRAGRRSTELIAGAVLSARRHFVARGASILVWSTDASVCPRATLRNSLFSRLHNSGLQLTSHSLRSRLAAEALIR